MQIDTAHYRDAELHSVFMVWTCEYVGVCVCVCVCV